MSNHDFPRDACERFDDQLELYDTLSPVEREELDEHVRQCPECRAMAAAREHLRFDGSPGAAAPLDELSERRRIAAIVEEAQQPDEREEPVHRWRPMVGQLLAASLAAVCVGAALAWLLLPRGPQPVTVAAQVLLSTADASSSDGAVETRSGELALQLAPNVHLWAGPNTRMKLSTDRDCPAKVDLTAGALLISKGSSACDLEVTTPDGTVFVRGTVLRVKAQTDETEVHVLRGEVSVRRRAGRSASVTPASGLALRSGERIPLPKRERDYAQARLFSLGVLSTPASVQLVVESVPEGARVVVDGAHMGASPVTAAVSPGPHTVEVSLAGYQSVQREIELDGDVRSKTERVRLLPVEQETGVEDVEPEEENGERRPRAGALLKKAQGHRAARRWQDAASAYGKIIRWYEDSPQAQVARLGLAEILVEHLAAPRRAMALFEDHQKRDPNGPMTAEVLLGRATCAAKLGEQELELLVLREFLRRFPSAMEKARVEARVDHLIRRLQASPSTP